MAQPSDVLPDLMPRLDPELAAILARPDGDKPRRSSPGGAFVAVFLSLAVLGAALYVTLLIGDGRSFWGVPLDAAKAPALLTGLSQILLVLAGLAGVALGVRLGRERG
jgi:hypothetical protein